MRYINNPALIRDIDTGRRREGFLYSTPADSIGSEAFSFTPICGERRLSEAESRLRKEAEEE